MKNNILEKFEKGQLTKKDLENFFAEQRGKGNGRTETSYYDADGNLVALKCWAFKRWFLVDKTRFPENYVEFGKKSSLKSGFNSMSKEGCARWYKLNNEIKKKNDQLLKDLITKKIDQDTGAEKFYEIERQGRDVRFYKDDGSLNEDKMSKVYNDWDKGFDSLEELRKAVKDIYKIDI